jgi:hypothetical protein
MEFIGNHANKQFLSDLVTRIQRERACESVDAAVAYVEWCDPVFDLCSTLGIPFHLRCLCNHEAQPSVPVVQRFLNGPGNWFLLLTQDYYHPKVVWFRGAGAYIGSANFSQRAWWNNTEAGVFLTEKELIAQGLDLELQALLDHVDGRSRSVVPADLDAIKALRECRRLREKDLEQASRKRFAEAFERIPGEHAESTVFSRTDKKQKDPRRDAFIQEWTQTQTLLGKLHHLLAEGREPRPWVPVDTPLSVEVDQILTWYYEDQIAHREAGVVEMVARLHQQNVGRGDGPFLSVVRDWQAASEMMPFICTTLSDWAPELRMRLTPERLKDLREGDLPEILRRSHAIQDHAYRVRNSVLGLPEGTQLDGSERLDLFAKWLWKQRTPTGKSIRDVLLYVLWHDTEPLGQRLWNAAMSPSSGWAIPRFKVSSLGELLGWARPDTFPPRNNRISRALYALGYEGVARYGDG